MRALLLLIGIATAAAASPARGQTADERQLAWVEGANPGKMFADSVRAGRLHLLTVCGLGCAEPGVGTLTYAHCYARAVDRVVVDGTGDVIHSRRHQELKERIRAFAEQYNALVLTELDRTGQRHCPAGERWDAYWDALNALAEAVPGRYRSFVTAVVELGPDQPDFRLHIQDERELSAKLYGRACALAPRFGLRGRVRFEVTTGNINDNPRRHPPFSCVRGRVTA
jgi:hypothetical protein